MLRRKRDGRFLAADLPEGLLALVPRLRREPGSTPALDALESLHPHTRAGLEHRRRTAAGPPAGTPATRSASTALTASAPDCRSSPNPTWLALAGFDRYRRPLWLHVDAARAWSHMREAALRDDVVLEAISGYRSHDYQLGIFERKLARGLTVDEILTVNAAPGYSEHHSGLALDIGAPDEPPAEESFEHTRAFAWLREHAGGFGFVMSYPRDNPHGIVYEPWHWRYQAG